MRGCLCCLLASLAPSAAALLGRLSRTAPPRRASAVLKLSKSGASKQQQLAELLRKAQQQQSEPDVAAAPPPAPPVGSENYASTIRRQVRVDAKPATYADFDSALGGSSSSPRPLSDGRLARGAVLPLPASLASLGGSQGYAFGNLAALANGAPLLVLIASSEASPIASVLRQTVLTFAGSLPEATAAKLGAGLASVSRVPAPAQRKLARKGNVGFPLLSDPSGEWTGMLDCEPSGAPQVIAAMCSARSTCDVAGTLPISGAPG